MWIESDRLEIEFRLNLAPGRYQLKWVIDGVWTVNRAMSVVRICLKATSKMSSVNIS